MLWGRMGETQSIKIKKIHERYVPEGKFFIRCATGSFSFVDLFCGSHVRFWLDLFLCGRFFAL